MPTIIIPSGKKIAEEQPYTCTLMERVITDLCDPAKDFTGFVSIASGDSLFLLFFFRGRPYSAGKSIGEKPFFLSLKEFFIEISNLADTIPVLSIHATDPVLLKCLLIFIQDDPTAKAPTSLINIEAILEQIQLQAADALVILEKQQMFNFFFFKDGTKGMSYFADHEFNQAEGLKIDEQLLLYSFQPDSQVDAMIYRDIATRESTDSVLLSREEMLRLLKGEAAPGVPAAEVEQEIFAVVELVEDNLLLQVLEGPQKGSTLSGPIPCVIGRKDSDIIVNDPMVSKCHAAVQVVNGKLLLVDLNSTNGTFVNGEQIKQRELAAGDVILLGESRMKIVRLTL